MFKASYLKVLLTFKHFLHDKRKYANSFLKRLFRSYTFAVRNKEERILLQNDMTGIENAVNQNFNSRLSLRLHKKQVRLMLILTPEQRRASHQLQLLLMSTSAEVYFDVNS